MDPKAETKDVTDAIERIARTFETAMAKRSPLHLASCGGCGGPTFQQPCPHCGFYPMGDAAEQKARTVPLTAERFKANVERSHPDGTGNLATWYFSNFRKSPAYKPHSSYAAKVDALVAEGAAMGDMPAPEAVFDIVTTQAQVVRRDQPAPDVSVLWDALHEVDAAFEREREAESGSWRTRGSVVIAATQETRQAAERARKGVIAVAHGDDGAWDGALDDLDETFRGILDVGGSWPGPGSGWVPTGNLVNARKRIDGVRERRAENLAPSP